MTRRVKRKNTSDPFRLNQLDIPIKNKAADKVKNPLLVFLYSAVNVGCADLRADA